MWVLVKMIKFNLSYSSSIIFCRNQTKHELYKYEKDSGPSTAIFSELHRTCTSTPNVVDAQLGSLMLAHRSLRSRNRYVYHIGQWFRFWMNTCVCSQLTINANVCELRRSNWHCSTTIQINFFAFFKPGRNMDSPQQWKLSSSGKMNFFRWIGVKEGQHESVSQQSHSDNFSGRTRFNSHQLPSKGKSYQ